jgi:hypothetical protein
VIFMIFRVRLILVPLPIIQKGERFERLVFFFFVFNLDDIFGCGFIN